MGYEKRAIATRRRQIRPSRPPASSHSKVFTAANAFMGTIDFFRQPEAKASVHLLISRTGAVVQFASFDEMTWHAGVSRWTSPDGTSFVGLNNYSIGISYDNLGEVHKTDSGQFVSSSGHVINPSDVECFGERSSENCWQSYTSSQLNVTKGLISALFVAYGRLPLLGHSEISPGMKTDPGPAFPIEKLRKQFGLVGSTT
jgi:N-acetylmuramoyl-L-alanine amidase